MTQPVIEKRPAGGLQRFTRWQPGLPKSELIWGALFLLSMLAAMALAIWSSIAGRAE